MSKNVLWQITVDCPHCCLPQSMSNITSHVALCSSRPSKFAKNFLVPSSLEDGSATAGYQTKPRMFSGTVSMILRATTTSQWILCYVSRMSDYGLHVGTYYSGITDDALDGAIQEIKSDFPAVGYRMTHGILIGRGIRVQVSRVREAMRRCDPEGVALRWLRGMHSRRVYSVHGPQALWHIDGNHKLIRYSLTAQFSAVDSVSTKCFTGGDLLSMVAWTVFLGCPFTFAAAQTIRLLQFYSIFFRPSMSTDCRLGLDVTKEAKITTLHGTC